MKEYLDVLVRHTQQLHQMPANEELCLQVLEALKPMFDGIDPPFLADMVDSFVVVNWRKLRQIFDGYRDDTRFSYLLFEPVALILFLLVEIVILYSRIVGGGPYL